MDKAEPFKQFGGSEEWFDLLKKQEPNKKKEKFRQHDGGFLDGPETTAVV